MVCDLVSFSNLVCDLGFSRGLKRLKKSQKGLERSVSADSGFKERFQLKCSEKTIAPLYIGRRVSYVFFRLVGVVLCVLA